MGFINIHSVAKYEKTRRGDPFETLNFFRKSRTVPKNIERGTLLVPSGFVGYHEKVKKGGTFGLSLPWPDLALGGFRIVSKKWTDQCEDCSLKVAKSRSVPKKSLKNRSEGTVNTTKNSKGLPLTFLRHSLGLRRKVCKKWTIQCEVCGLIKKLASVRVRNSHKGPN